MIKDGDYIIVKIQEKEYHFNCYSHFGDDMKVTREDPYQVTYLDDDDEKSFTIDSVVSMKDAFLFALSETIDAA